MLKHLIASTTNTTLTKAREEDYTPNAIDLRVAKVLRIHNAPFTLSEDVKKHRGSTEELPDEGGWWTLPAGSYEIVMENIVNVGAYEAGIVIPRSTLNRNGVFLTSGLYDSGYHGVMAACMHVTTGTFILQKGTRVGQYLILAADMVKAYDGSYGLDKQHDKKYEV